MQHDQEALIETLRHELAVRNREVARLHEVISSQAKAIEITTAALPANAQTVEQPVPLSTAMRRTGGREDALEQSGTLWARIRKWFSGD